MSLVGKLVVFGGNGFLGRRVCEAAVNSGFAVTSVSSSGRSPKPVVQEDSKWISRVNWSKGDVFRPETYRQEIKDCTGVVHSIGILLENSNYKKMVRSTDDIFGTIESFFKTPSGNPMKKRPKLEKGVDPETREDNEPVLDLTYERMNKESALVLADALLGCNEKQPAFVYISADRGFPFVPSGYIESKRQAEYELYQLQPGIRPILMRPGFMYDELAAGDGGFRDNMKKFVDLGRTVNSKLLGNMLDGLVRPTISTQTVAKWVVKRVKDADFRGPVLMDEMVNVKI